MAITEHDGQKTITHHRVIITRMRLGSFGVRQLFGGIGPELLRLDLPARGVADVNREVDADSLPRFPVKDALNFEAIQPVLIAKVRDGNTNEVEVRAKQRTTLGNANVHVSHYTRSSLNV